MPAETAPIPPEPPAPAVVAALKPQAVPPSEPRMMVKSPLAREVVLAAQRLLADQGYDPGPLDGLEGPTTRRAARAFLLEAGLMDVPGQKKTKVAEKPSQAAPPPKDVGLDGLVFPTYAAGDAYVYSDGRVETVLGVEGEKVFWRNNRGAQITAYRNFVLPVLSVATAVGGFENHFDAPLNALWPLEVGREAYFKTETELVEIDDAGGPIRSHHSWLCQVTGTEQMIVRAGTFETFRLACRTVSSSPLVPSERIWNYAPRIGHFVRLRERFTETGGADRDVELVAVHLSGRDWPPAARAGLGWARQHALETKAKGEGVEWKSSGVDAVVTIRPTTKLREDGGEYCRNFVEWVSRGDSTRIFPGIACRDMSGRWTVPGMDAGAHATAAVN